jgi:hypothetical protein
MFQFKIRVKPDKLEDTLLMYTGANIKGDGDFLGVVVEDERIVLKYDTGYG